MLKLLLVFCLSFYSTATAPHTFDMKEVREVNVQLISQMIASVQPKLNISKRIKIARVLSDISTYYKLDSKIIIAIIDVESGFDQSKVSHTGDVSLVQINPKVWSKEFERIGLRKLDVEKLKKNEGYALEKMAQILNNIKVNYEEKDKRWYARYHSKTKKLKDIYFTKINKRFVKMALLDVKLNSITRTSKGIYREPIIGSFL